MLRNENQEKLERVVDYYLDTSNLPTLSYEANKQVLLAIVTVSGAVLFINPAQSYVKNYEQDRLSEHINFSLGTAVTGLAVMYNATEIFLTTRKRESIPSELADILKNPLTPLQKKLKDGSILLGAAISALPMATVSLAYPIKNVPQWFNYIQTGLIEFDNTILHFLPIDLAFRAPLYRFPVLPLEYGYLYVKKSLMTKEQKQQAQLIQKKAAIYQSLKDKMINQLSQTQKAISLNGLSFNPASLSYKVKLPDDIKTMPSKTQPSVSGIKRLSTLLEYGKSLRPSLHFFSSSKVRLALGYVDLILSNVAYGVGASWILSSCIGSLAEPYNEGNHLLEDPTKAALAATPGIYFLSVLLTFFGGNALRDTYHYLTSWGDDQVKIPLEFKLYPKASALLLLFASYLAFYSYGGNCQLLEDNFKETELNFLIPHLTDLTMGGMPFLSIISMIGFYRTVINKFALHFGNDEAKMIAQLNLMIEQLKSGIQLMNGEDLLAALEELEERPLNAFGFKSNELDQLKQHLPQREKVADGKLVEATRRKLSIKEKAREEDPLLPKPAATTQGKSTSSWCPWLFKSGSSQPENASKVGLDTNLRSRAYS